MSMSFEDMAKLKVGDTIVEYSDYSNESLVSDVISEPVVSTDDKYTQVRFDSKTREGRVINYLATEGLMHYAPKLYHGDQSPYV